MPSIITKIFVALKECLSPKNATTPPRLIMTLLVKNEEVLLEQNILFHKAMGVDAFIVTDNNSQDRTPQIIQKYIDKGWIVESIKEPGTNYDQKAWVDRMIWSAKSCHNADWVINCDADEFWFSASCDLKSEMSGKANALRCKVMSVCPDDRRDWSEWDRVAKPIPTPDISKYDLSPYNIYKRFTYKVAHSTSRYIKISMGNHKVKMLFKNQKNSDIVIYHYNILGRDSFIKKMVNGGQQIENNPKKSVARHWRYFYELYKSNSIEREYDRIIGSKYIDEFQKLGYLYRDDSVAKTLKNISK